MFRIVHDKIYIMDEDLDADQKKRLRAIVPKVRFYKKQERWVCPVRYATAVRTLFDHGEETEDRHIQKGGNETNDENGIIPIRMSDVLPRRYEFDVDPDIVSFFHSRIQI